MPVGRKRRHNRHLPQGVTLEFGTYYFRGADRKRINLGKTLGDAMRSWADIVEPPPGSLQTMSGVFARYRVEVLPRKAAVTQQKQKFAFPRLEVAFGKMAPGDIRQRHAYAYLNERSGKTPGQALKEISILSHCLSMCVIWGVIDTNPLLKMRRGQYTLKPRDRYVTDAEYAAVYVMATERVQIAMDLALLTGLRRGDILALTRDSVTEEGLLVHTSKTGKALLIELSDELRVVIERALRLTPRVRRPLLCTRSGKRYSADGFGANWRRLITKAVKEGKIESRFTFHDLRAKSASDDTLAVASERLGHTSQAVTKRVYVRKPVKVRPLR